MATTTNYSWSTPDDTALVKDGAAAIRSLGTAIDSTVFTNAGAAINKSIVDVKGDIIAATAADTVARLAVGANDTVLTADSSTATGLKWAAASAGGMTLLSTTTMSGATVTLSSIPQTYKTLYGIIFGVTNDTSTAFHYIRPNGTSEAQYSVFSGTNSNATKVLQGSEFTWNFEVSGYSLKRTNSGNVSFFEIHNYTSATSMKAINSSGYYVGNNDANVAYAGAGGYYNTSAITSIDFVNNGNYTYSAGTILLYGVK